MGEKPRYLWQAAVIRWISESEKKSIETDKYQLKWLRTFLDDVYIDDINEALIEKIIAEKLKVAGKTRVNRTTELIRSILNKSMKEWKWIDNVPYITSIQRKQSAVKVVDTG